MRTPLAPVETRSTQGAASPRVMILRPEVDPKLAQEAPAVRRDHAGSIIQDDEPAGGECVGERDPQPSRKMVVACARGAQRLIARPRRPMAFRSTDRHCHERFDGRGRLWEMPIGNNGGDPGAPE